jgi:uncharacterized membrane protein
MWTAATGTVPLPDIPGGTGNTLATVTAVSGDGRYIVGASRNSSGTPRPVRWHNGVAEHIGLSAGGQPNTGVALDCTADGSVVVGNVIPGNEGAFIWDAAHGYRDLNAALARGLRPCHQLREDRRDLRRRLGDRRHGPR